MSQRNSFPRACTGPTLAATVFLIGCQLCELVAPGSAAATTVTETIIYSFLKYPTDGSQPLGGVVADSQGRLYGTTSVGGVYPGSGTVWCLTPPAPGQTTWTEAILHNFSNKNGDGSSPRAAVVLGPDGSIYGTTFNGGVNNLGTVFKLTNSPGWPETILHSFAMNEGAHPASGVVFGPNGLLYGTTSFYLEPRTVAVNGTNFSISPQGDGVEFQIIDRISDAAGTTSPVGLSYDSASNALLGGTDPLLFGGDGAASISTVYALQAGPKGGFKAQTLYTFGLPPDVSDPATPMLAGIGQLKGAAFGCALEGGPNAPYVNGGIYEITQAGSGFADSVIFDFPAIGFEPTSGSFGCSVIQEGSGSTLFGITGGGGNIFFGLTAPATAGGAWQEQTYASFSTGISPQYPMAAIQNNVYVAFTSDPVTGNGNVMQLTVKP